MYTVLSRQTINDDDVKDGAKCRHIDVSIVFSCAFAKPQIEVLVVSLKILERAEQNRLYTGSLICFFMSS